MYGVMPYNIVMATMTRTASIDMRLTEEEKRLIEQASAATGSRLTTWCINNLINDAKRDLHANAIIRLSDEAFDRFVENLDRPLTEKQQQFLAYQPEWAGPRCHSLALKAPSALSTSPDSTAGNSRSTTG